MTPQQHVSRTLDTNSTSVHHILTLLTSRMLTATLGPCPLNLATPLVTAALSTSTKACATLLAPLTTLVRSDNLDILRD